MQLRIQVQINSNKSRANGFPCCFFTAMGSEVCNFV